MDAQQADATSSRPRRSPGAGARSSTWSSPERRLYPVGRLDADSTGLILLTNDGELANRLTHPRFEVPKTYGSSCAGRRRTRSCGGCARASSSTTARPRPAKVRRAGEREIEITIREGRNRQVRRMVEAVGNEVVALRRVRFGSLRLGDLAPGEAGG